MLNTLPSKTVAIPYTCGLSAIDAADLAGRAAEAEEMSRRAANAAEASSHAAAAWENVLRAGKDSHRRMHGMLDNRMDRIFDWMKL